MVEIAVPLLLAGVLTWWATVSGFDFGAEWWIHHIGGDTWAIGDHPFWSLLYEAGTYPATVVVFAALALLAASWKTARLQRWRRVFVFLILSGLIGPGVITNVILKEYWGRPRPRELVDFGGRSAFEPALTIDLTSNGMSFPCGHATMGFYFLAFYFLLRRHKPGMAQGTLFLSLSAGGLMGLARMTQGAHFFTDVVWAGGVCW
ncbi:MAG TPA: phosphatase PAP2 family protein, partial [Bacteroidia bacterium]|nr:phosphatase PAP2 family protein [Bacteroidia bacterium]